MTTTTTPATHADELIDQALLDRFNAEYVADGKLSAFLHARVYLALLAHRDDEAAS